MNWQSKHNLQFEVAPYYQPIDDGHKWYRFRVGTCNGLWASCDTSYKILAIDNERPGNGHFDDVLQWFERSCKRDKRNLIIMAIMNDRFYDHLINKRGFKLLQEKDVYKPFREMK